RPPQTGAADCQQKKHLTFRSVTVYSREAHSRRYLRPLRPSQSTASPVRLEELVEPLPIGGSMPAVATIEQFLETVRKSGLVEDKALDDYVSAARAAGKLPDTPQQLARAMVRDGLVTHFQASQLLGGKTRGFVLNGKYKLLEHLGAGGMGTVYLCEHTSMRRRVAIKVLPVVKAQHP